MGPAFDITINCTFGNGQIFNISELQTTFNGEQCDTVDNRLITTPLGNGVVQLYISELPSECTYVVTLPIEVSLKWDDAYLQATAL